MSTQQTTNKTLIYSSPSAGLRGEMDTSVPLSSMYHSESVPFVPTHDVQPIANSTLTDENIIHITTIVMNSIQAQIGLLVQSIVDGVLLGLKGLISSLENKNKSLKSKLTILEDKLDKAEQYSRRNCLRLSED